MILEEDKKKQHGPATSQTREKNVDVRQKTEKTNCGLIHRHNIVENATFISMDFLPLVTFMIFFLLVYDVELSLKN